MKDLGHYKTTEAQTYRCYFDQRENSAFAMGPLPDMKVAVNVKAENEPEAARKLAQNIGNGVFSRRGE